MNHQPHDTHTHKNCKKGSNHKLVWWIAPCASQIYAVDMGRCMYLGASRLTRSISVEEVESLADLLNLLVTETGALVALGASTLAACTT